MPVNSTHPEYDAALPAWLRARDVLAGEDAVKAAGTKYLPRLDSQSDEEYAAYKGRASFFGATGRTVKEYLDLVFRKAPVFALCATAGAPEEGLKRFVADCDRWGLEFVGHARRVVSEVLSVGRAGSLVRWDASGQPVVSLWKAEDILNWKVERLGDSVAVVEVVLRDPPASDDSSATSAERIRVLRLVDGVENGSLGEQALPRVCVQETWNPPAPDDSGATGGGWVLQERVALKRDGVELSFIPFVFHGPRNSRPEPDGLPLADIIAANLDHYRLDADYKQGLHFAALPTAWVSGFDKSAPLRIGSSTAWVSDVPGASAGYLEFSGQGLAHLERAIEKVERRMALLGARMGTGVPANGLPGGAVAEPGGESELFGLGSMVASLNGSLSHVLRMAQWWIEGGELRAQRASIAMDTDLNSRVVTAELISAMVGAWRDGGMSRETLLHWLKRWEVLPEGRTIEEEKALIHGKAKV